MNNKEQFLKIMDFRHACKVFDDTKKISDEDMHYILEVARKSPSSFGMEAWKFLVITNDELREKLRPLCWNQVQITSCSHLVIALAGVQTLKVESGVVKSQLMRRNLPEDKLDAFINVYASHLKDVLHDDDKIYQWSARQTYIACANMMSAAASIKIDSCPIEGFEKEKVEEVLGLDTTKFQVSMILPFGYRINEQSKQLRSSFENVIEFIK